MILRAIFWIGLVAVLMPREPDLGFGRPSADSGLTAALADWTRDKVETNFGDDDFCRNNVQACTTGTTLLDDVKAATLRNLAAVKADIARSSRARLPDSSS
jgi:hypothetical protein